MMVTRDPLNRLRLKRNRLVPTLVLLASCSSLIALLSPVTAEKNGNVSPHDPFKRLLIRLDHTPFDFDKVEASAKRGSAMQKIRKAMLFGTCLRRSRRREDLPATVEALDAAIAPVNGYEASGERQNRKLGSYIKALGTINDHYFANCPEKQKDSDTVKNAIAKLQKTNTNLGAQTAGIQQTRLYTEACAAECHAAIGTSQIESIQGEPHNAKL